MAFSGTRSKFDLILAGGGLANGLLAWRLAQARPDLRFVVLEEGASLGGDRAHTWSFHEDDVGAEMRTWLHPLLRRSWPGYTVRFPRFERELAKPYHSIDGRRFHERIARDLGDRLWLGARVRSVSTDAVELEDGRRLSGSVLDGRGTRELAPGAAGFQKFVGWDVELAEPHGVRLPMLMDAGAGVEQLEGFRFVYLLPWNETSVLIEDTRYADAPGVDETAYGARIESYAAARGWRIERITRRESGCLPIPLARQFTQESVTPVNAVGMRAGLFHFTTGYSLPSAARTAWALAAQRDLSPPALFDRLEGLRRELTRDAAFQLLLNRLLFLAAKPERRYDILQRFYRLPAPSIARFYAGQLTGVDRMRILLRRPPVPMTRAVRALFPREAPQ